MRQKYRTTCFADEPLRYERSFEDEPDRRGDVVGFRLVHHDANRGTLGSSWNRDPQRARVVDLSSGGPAISVGRLGFRLVVDWRKE